MHYRIVQVNDQEYQVEKLHQEHEYRGWLWWRRLVVVEQEWRPAGLGFERFFKFTSQQAAQKWLDDRRKYPLVLKDPA